MRLRIIVSILITLVIYAFPLSRFGLGAPTFYLLKILKCIVAIILMLIVIRKEFSQINILFKSHSKRVMDYFPILMILLIYTLLNFSKFKGIPVGSGLIISMVIATFFAAFSEELIFRGYFQNVLLKQNIPIIKSILLSSLVFSLTHIINISSFGGDLWAVLNQITFAFFWGLLMGSLYVLHKNILFITICHFIFNLPSAFRYLKEYSIESISLMDNQQSSFFDNITSSLVWVALCSPILFLALFYMKSITVKLND